MPEFPEPGLLIHHPAYYAGSPLDVVMPAPPGSIPSDFEGLVHYTGQLFDAPLGSVLSTGPPYLTTVNNVIVWSNATSSLNALAFLRASIQPNTGQIGFRLGDVISLLIDLETFLPAPGQATARLIDSATRQIRFVATANAGTVEIGRSAEQDFIILAGGLPLQHRHRDDFFTEYADGYLPFLTAQPNPAPVVSYQPVWLYRLLNFPVVGKLVLHGIIMKADGSQVALVPGSGLIPVRGQVAVFPAGPTELNLPASAVQYHVWLQDDTGKRLSEVRSYVIDRSPYQNPEIIVFNNGLGGFDSLAFYGQGEAKARFSGETAIRVRPPGSPINQRLHVQLNRYRSTEYTMRTGFLPEANWLNYLQSLLLSSDVRILRTGFYVPLRQASTELTLLSGVNRTLAAELSFATETGEPYYFTD